MDMMEQYILFLWRKLSLKLCMLIPYLLMIKFNGFIIEILFK